MIKNLLLTIACVVLPVIIHAKTGPTHANPNFYKAVDAVALDSEAAITINTEGWAQAALYISVTTDATVANRQMTMTCTASPDGGTTDFQLQSCTNASGVCTSDDASWSLSAVITASSTKSWVWNVGVLGYKHVECAPVDDIDDSGDTMTIWVGKVTQ